MESELIDGYDPENYEVGTPVVGYANKATPNTTLAVLTGRTDIPTRSPGVVALEEAIKAREQDVELWKAAAQAEAVKGNSPALVAAAQTIQQLQQPQTSFVENVDAIAQQRLETLAAQYKMPLEDFVTKVKVAGRNISVTAALESAALSFAERGGVSQFAQDITGVTTGLEWGGLTPVINKALEPYGAQPSLTVVGSAEEFITLINNADTDDDANRIVSHLVDVLRTSSVIPAGTARRFFETVINLTERSKTQEAVFGGLDVLGITALLKGAAMGVRAASKGIAATRAVGAHEKVVQDVVAILADKEKSVLGTSQLDAVKASLSTAVDSLAGLSPSVQKNLRTRIENSIKSINEALYTGGANAAELQASKANYERIYSRERNSAIMESRAVINENKGRIDLDVLYGNRDGTPFATAEEALEYGRKWVAGKLEVVPVDGGFNVKRLAELDDEFNKLIDKFNSAVDDVNDPNISEFKYGDGSAIDPNDPWALENARLLKEKAAGNVIVKKWSSVKERVIAKLNPLERTIAEPLLRALDDNFEIWWSKTPSVDPKRVRAHQSGYQNRVVIYGDQVNDPVVIAHELIHANTTAKIDAWRSGTADKATKIALDKMEELRVFVQKQAATVADPRKKAYIDYLTKNMYEFSTMAVWRDVDKEAPWVAEWLNTLQYKNKSFYLELWDAVKQLLGLKQNTALSEWLNLTEELAKRPVRHYLSDGTVLRTRGAFGESIVDVEKQLADNVAERVALSMGPPRPGYALRQQVDMPVLLQDLGKYTADEVDNLMFGVAGRLNPRLAAITSIYTPALASSLKRNKFSRVWAQQVSDAFDKLDQNTIDKVNDALIQTEGLKRDMTPTELGAYGVSADDAQEAYYAYRLMREQLWLAKNEEARTELVSRGYQQVFSELGSNGTFSGPAKRLDEWSSLIGKRVLDTETNKFIMLDEDKIIQYKARGMSLYDFAKAQEVPGHKALATKIMLPTHKTSVGDIKTVVGRVDGAYSRIYMDEFFIKIKGNLLVDDEMQNVKYAFRTAASEADAADYAQRFNKLIASGTVTADDVRRIMGHWEDDAEALAAQVNSGKFIGTQAEFNYTRMEGNFFRDVTGIGASDKTDGKVFWSGRGEEAIKSISTQSRDAIIAGPLASLEREIANTAAFVGMDEWRRNSIQKWFNTFEDVIDVADKMTAKSADDVFFNFANRAAFPQGSNKRVIAAWHQARFIVNQLNVRTADERYIEHTIDRLSRVVDEKIGDKPYLRHVGRIMRQTDLINWIKGKASTLMLGMFNPAQIFVQSSGMLNAIAISPKHGLKSAYLIRPYLAALNSDNGSVWKFIHKTFDKVQPLGMPAEEFTRVVAAIRNSGLLDNIGASSMYSAEDGALNVFSRRRRKFDAAQMGFFNKGEEISRVAAFDIARREFIEANADAVWDTNENILLIMQRADDLTQNMQRINEARYAKGLGGIPLQFLQHNIRLGTNMYSALVGALTGKTKTLSPKDAIQLLFGSVALYGVNNVGLEDTLESMLGEYTKEWTPEARMYLAQGILAGGINSLTEAVTGESAKLAFGSRLSSLQWYEDLVDGIYGMFKDGQFPVEVLSGPSGSVIVDSMDIGKLALDYLQRPEWTTTSFLQQLSAMGGTLVSTWGNLEKAYYASQIQNNLYNRRGDKVAELTNMEVIWQALGISSVEAQEAGYIFKSTQSHRRVMESYTNTMLRLQKQHLQAATDEDKRIIRDQMALLYHTLSPGDQRILDRNMASRISPQDTVYQSAVRRWATDMSTRGVDKVTVGE